MSDVFISYAREDRERILPLVRALEQRGWSVFWDRLIPAGETWRQVITEEIDAARCVIVLWSTASVSSHWVTEEADEGRRRGVIIPVRIQDVLPPMGFRSLQTSDLSGWNGDSTTFALQALLNDVAATLNGGRGRNQASASSGSRAWTSPPVRPVADAQTDVLLPNAIPAPPSYDFEPLNSESYTGSDQERDGHGLWWLLGRGVAALFRLLFFLLSRLFEVAGLLLFQLARVGVFLGTALLRKGRRLFVLTTAVYFGMTWLLGASVGAAPEATLLFAFNGLVLAAAGTLAGFGKTQLSNVCAVAGIVEIVILGVSLIATGPSWVFAAQLSLGFVALFFALCFRYRSIERRRAAQAGA